MQQQDVAFSSDDQGRARFCEALLLSEEVRIEILDRSVRHVRFLIGPAVPSRYQSSADFYFLTN